MFTSQKGDTGLSKPGEIKTGFNGYLVKFQPDIPILMVMGDKLTVSPKTWGKGENRLKMMPINLRPQTLKLSCSTHNKSFMV
jgi:hypothetical protein